MTGLVTAMLLLAYVAAPIVLVGMSMFPGIDDALAGTTANRPKSSGPALFFYLLGFRIAPLVRVFA